MAGREQAQNRYWRSLVAKALLTARGALSTDPGTERRWRERLAAVLGS